MRIYLGLGRFVVNAQLIRENFYTALVCLASGKYIKRYKNTRGFVDFNADKVREAIPEPIFAAKRVTFWDRLVSLLKRIWVTLVREIGQQESKGE